MYPKISVNLGNLILSLSDALDLAFPSLAMHQQRTAFIAWEIAKKAKLPDQRIEHVFLAGLLHDIGALSIEEKKSLHDNEIFVVERHCIRGERLFKSNRWLEPCANLVKLLLMNIEDVRRSITESQEEIRHYYKTEVERSVQYGGYGYPRVGIFERGKL